MVPHSFQYQSKAWHNELVPAGALILTSAALTVMSFLNSNQLISSNFSYTQC